jgi:NAD(P)-dependent dehydrogenase (short-subunit alcohol dehydrogenase family)
MTDLVDLSDKRVVVTGASRGLGRSYAIALGRAGAAVVVNARDTAVGKEVADEVRKAGGRAVVSGLSVADPDEAAGLIAVCVEEFGGIDSLVNNAAQSYSVDAWEDTPTRQAELMTTNVLGTMWTGNAAIVHMKKAGGGSIINSASGSAIGSARGAAYSGSKGAVLGITYSWAEELAPYGIRVNAVSPFAKTSNNIANGPHPDNVAPLVVWLVSDLSKSITGQNIRLVGDNLCLVAPPTRVGQPTVTSPTWDVETIDKAFKGEFDGKLHTVGQLLKTVSQVWAQEPGAPPTPFAPVDLGPKNLAPKK